MITPDHAWHVVCNHISPLESVSLPLKKVLGHCLAETIRADRDYPPADRAAMDGFAVRSIDLQAGGTTLPLIGEIVAGIHHNIGMRSGTCVRIATGGNMPRGADSVVPVEQSEEQDGAVTFLSSIRLGANIFKQGEDTSRGTVLLKPGTYLGSGGVGVCAAVGRKTVKVFRKPRIALVCTGTEIKAAGGSVTKYQMRNSNGPTLRAALAQWGFAASSPRQAPDRVAALSNSLLRLLPGHDVILLTGGISVGKHDLVRAALEAIGAAIQFHGLAMKPAKPTLYATMGANCHIFGLPGNPLSAMTACHEFVLPALRRLTGSDPDACRPVLHLPLTVDLRSKAGRARYILAQIQWEEKGPCALPIHSKSSADLFSASGADGVIIAPPKVEFLKAGTIVAFRPWRPLP
jgi:molybdopterin molybdotransferase